MTNRYGRFLMSGVVAGLLLTAQLPGWAQKSGEAGAKPPAKPKVGMKWTSPVDGLAMVWAPPGEFLMGSPASEAGRSDDETQHRVQIAKGFWMDATEVTNEAFQKFLLAKPAWQKDKIDPRFHDTVYLKDWSGTSYKEGQKNFPVGGVSWYAARAYCEWAGGRLPTEAEWEYAARAGTTTAYWWGDTFDETKATRLGPGGSKREEAEPVGNPTHINPWGLADILGNAQEWTSSLNTPYPYRADDGRESPENKDDRYPCAEGMKPAFRSCRAVRGGSYQNPPTTFRAAKRFGLDPTFSSRRFGFRCVQ